MATPEILCVGEVLWDSLPSGLFLGGAPFNVAAHLHALGAPVGVITRVGSDRLGTEALQRLRRRGISTDLVQVDPVRETGFVSVVLDASGIPAYEILEPAAWDFIELKRGLQDRAARTAALVFGSLAQRSPVSRGTIEQLCDVAAVRVFDVNLRPPHDNPQTVRQSLARADIVKLNEHELQQVSAWFGLPQGLRKGAIALAESFSCRTVCVTRGGNGAALLHEGRWAEHPGYQVEVKDTVGSGDAFLAAFLSGLLAGHDDQTILQDANLLGAYVATQFGAIPVHRTGDLAVIIAASEEADPPEVLRSKKDTAAK